MNLDANIGSFNIGKDFDALLIDVCTDNSPIDFYENSIDPSYSQEYVLELLERFIHLGDDRNIIQVYVKGQKIFKETD